MHHSRGPSSHSQKPLRHSLRPSSRTSAPLRAPSLPESPLIPAPRRPWPNNEPLQRPVQRGSRAGPLHASLLATVAAATVAAAQAEPLGQTLLGVAALIASLVAGVLVFLSVPVIVAAARALRESELLMKALRKEVPDTLAVLRLSGMELSDVLQEFGGLGSDLTGGVRSMARAVTATETGVKEGSRAITERVLPGALGALEARAKENKKLQHSVQALAATKAALQRTRFALGSGAVAAQAVTMAAAGRNLKELMSGGKGQGQAPPPEYEAGPEEGYDFQRNGSTNGAA